ncbi:MAG: class I SAM-dependent methyltransferase [Gaiellaceae bacterium]
MSDPSGAPSSSDPRALLWDSVYDARGASGVSWYQAVPSVSLELIESLHVPRDAAVIDIGGGASFLADSLVELGYSDVTVLDVSASALEQGRRRLGDDARTSRLHEDLLSWHPLRRYDVWHDRAVFHFLVKAGDRERYFRTLLSAVRPGGVVMLATFAPDGPDHCSGLPVARYSAEDLAEVIGDAFEPVHVRREEHITPQGVIQPFTWVAGRIRADTSLGDTIRR